ncbi:MAG: glycosyl hydrolase [Limisphaerales bacterium]
MKLASCFAASLCAGALFAAAAQTDLPSRFTSPPPDARIHKIIHGWPDKPEAQDDLLGKLRQRGFGGVVCNISFDQYLESEAKWTAFTRAVNETKKAGLAMWLYDERGYPSGNAGGITMRDHPEWEAYGLLIADTETQGGAVALDLPPGKLFLAAAFPVRDGNIDRAKQVDLAARVRAGKLAWEAPPGLWRVMAITESRLFEGTHADGNLHAKIPYINMLRPEPTARFLEVTHDAYARRLGRDLGQYFMGAFTDEPSLMSLFLKPMPYRPLPWAPNLPVEFKKRRGYALDAGVVPALVAEAGAAGEKIRHDFWLTVGELVSENYFGQIQTRCRQYNFPSGGHLLMEENIASHVALYGDFFRCIRRLDAPSIDCLTSLPPEVPWYIARLLASAGELEGRPLVMSETSDHSQRYRPAGDQRPRRVVTEAEIRGTCNRLIVSGVNDITSYYSFADLTDEQLRHLNEWVGRCCTMLRGGHQVADIAVLYPSDSLGTHFVPSHNGTREATAANRIQNLYRAAADSLFTSQRDFTFIDGRALAEAKADSGTLVHGQLRWRVIVLPGADTLPLAAWENLARFVRGGGMVIALGALPLNSESEFPSPKVQALAKEMFGVSSAGVTSSKEPVSHSSPSGGAGTFLPSGTESLLSLVLNGALDPDVTTASGKSPVRVTHRRLDKHEVYFVINDSAKPWSGELSFAATGAGERWDPATGRTTEAATATAAKLSLDPYGATFFRFPAARLPQKRAIAGGALPNLSLRPVPNVTPTSVQGEFVRAGLTPDTAHSTPDAPAWVATAVLTKAQVDTYLFTQFHYAQPLDLSGAEVLALETWAPAGQKASGQLLVILHEQDGGDFVASTTRSLAVSGRERSLLPLTRFELAGWSKAGGRDGVPDLKRISDIRVGWGGYLGAEGEKVQFSVALPQVGSFAKKGR